MKYKNIFITGSTGVLGKPLLKKLIENSHEVYALSRSEESKKDLESQGVSVISGDILTSNLIDQFQDINIDAIFHVAGVNKMCSKNPQYMFDANIDGTKNILSLGNDLEISKFVYTSSAVTLGENLGSIGNENSTHRGHYLSKYEESKFLAEQEAFNFEKNFEFVSVNPSSVQGPGRVSGTAKLLISTLSKTYPPLIRNNISIVDIDDCTLGHYNALEFGKNNERYVLNSFQTSSQDLVNKLKTISSWNGRPVYIPKFLLKFISPLGDIYKLISDNTPLLCSESVRVLTHGHKYEGLKAKENLNIQYTNVDEFIKKTINWLIEEKYISLTKI
tara:strand:+ start:3618 stop:4613 length:996 start_codon:yes stop_codon:yes gene_type:complete